MSFPCIDHSRIEDAIHRSLDGKSPSGHVLICYVIARVVALPVDHVLSLCV